MAVVNGRVVDDVARCMDARGVFVGSLCIAGVKGASRGGQGGVAGCTGRCWGSWGWQSCSVECATRSDEHARTTSRNSVSWAVNRLCTLFTAL